MPTPKEIARRARESREATLVIRRRTPAPTPAERQATGHRPVTHEEFHRRHAAHADDMATVESWVEGKGLAVLKSSPLQRYIVVGGPRARLETVLSPAPGEPPGTPPPPLAEQVRCVIGLEEHPLARTHRRLLSSLRGGPGGGDAIPAGGVATVESPSESRTTTDAVAERLTVREVAELYTFPPQLGSGQTVGVLALAGGYHAEDLRAFAAAAGIDEPHVVDVLVHEELPEGAAARGANDPVPMEELAAAAEYLDTLEGDEPSAQAIFTVETTMDVELALGFAPAARIAVYFAASNDEQSFYQALSTAIFDTENRPSVLSLSWGWPESSWQESSGEPFVDAVERLLDEASYLGITFCASSGDAGSGGSEGHPSVQYPASSPTALSCGGTTLEVVGGRITSEVSWQQAIGETEYASGGGVSRLFEQPEWQRGIDLLDRRDGRGVPDVSGVADRGSGCAIRVGGRTITSGGTSAVAPMWAGLVARLNERLGRRLGNPNPRFYRLGAADTALFQDVVEGGNGEYEASAGWDPCTGLGTPHGERLAEALADDQGS